MTREVRAKLDLNLTRLLLLGFVSLGWVVVNLRDKQAVSHGKGRREVAMVGTSNSSLFPNNLNPLFLSPCWKWSLPLSYMNVWMSCWCSRKEQEVNSIVTLFIPPFHFRFLPLPVPWPWPESFERAAFTIQTRIQLGKLVTSRQRCIGCYWRSARWNRRIR